MNLAELRTLVGNLTDYDPNTTAYNADIDRLINDTYLNLFSMHPWSFAEKEATVTAYADVVLDIGVTITSRTITSATNGFLDWMEGQLIELSGTEYEIVQVASVGTAYLKLPCTAATGTVLGATIKMRFVDLPEDCINLLQVGSYQKMPADQPRGRFMPLARYEGDQYGLSYSTTGTPTSYLHADTVTVRAPVTPPTLSTHIATAWPAGSYNILVGYHYQNRYSAAMSTVLTHVSDGVTAVVPRLIFASTGTGSGYKRSIYLRGPGYTAYRLYSDDLSEGVLAFNMDTPPDLGSWEFFTRMPETGGTYQRIRMFPRQSENLTLTIRYIYRPALLIEDGDTPQFPEPDHHVLSEMGLTEVYVKSDQLAQSEVYRRKAILSITRMENSYLTLRPRRWVKQGWSYGTRAATQITLTHLP